MSDHSCLQQAEAVLAAVEAGDYDGRLGISPDQRALLTRAAGTDPLSLADVRALRAIARDDLIVAAHDAGRISFTDPEEI